MRSLTAANGSAVESPWFTAEEAAAYLRLESDRDSRWGPLHAFYQAYRRLGIPAYRFKGGRELRFRQPDLDATLTTAQVSAEASAGGGERKPTLQLASTTRGRSIEGSAKARRRGR